MAGIFMNDHEHRPRAFWRLLFQSIIFFTIWVVAQIIAGFIGLARAVAAGVSSSDVQALMVSVASDPLVLLLTGLGALLGIGLSYMAASRWLDKRSIAEYGFHFGAAWWKDLGFGLFLGVFLMAAIFLVEQAAGWVQVTHLFYSYRAGLSFGAGISIAILSYLCVGIYEEMLVRGYILRNIAEGLRGGLPNPRTALLIAYVLSSLLFGTLHLGNPNSSLVSTLNLVIAGLLLGLGYVLTGELAISIGLHITWNFFQGCVFGFPVSGLAPSSTVIAIQQAGPVAWTGGAFGPEAGFIGLGAYLLGSLLIVVWVRSTRHEAKMEERLADYQPKDADVSSSPVVEPSL